MLSHYRDSYEESSTMECHVPGSLVTAQLEIHPEWMRNQLSIIARFKPLDHKDEAVNLLGQWLNFTFFLGLPLFSRENKTFKLLFQGSIG